MTSWLARTGLAAPAAGVVGWRAGAAASATPAFSADLGCAAGEADSTGRMDGAGGAGRSGAPEDRGGAIGVDGGTAPAGDAAEAGGGTAPAGDADGAITVGACESPAPARGAGEPDGTGGAGGEGGVSGEGCPAAGRPGCAGTPDAAGGVTVCGADPGRAAVVREAAAGAGPAAPGAAEAGLAGAWAAGARADRGGPAGADVAGGGPAGAWAAGARADRGGPAGADAAGGACWAGPPPARRSCGTASGGGVIGLVASARTTGRASAGSAEVPLLRPSRAAAAGSPASRQEAAPAAAPMAGADGRSGCRPAARGPLVPGLAAAAGRAGPPGIRRPPASACRLRSCRADRSPAWPAGTADSAGAGLAAAWPDAFSCAAALSPAAAFARAGTLPCAGPVPGAAAATCATAGCCARPTAASPKISSRQITTPMTSSTAASALTPMAR